ncbi:MAG: hypothetical protein HOG49_31740 [Candidatus Scalindua sp.]|jgi:hypothetical protein|nr:hypothetical protein [Candidatus Scalindua sp.]
MRTAQEVIASLPPYCYSVTNVEDTERLIRIRAGQSGYEVVAQRHGDPKKTAELFNRNLNVTEAQHDAMVTGSMFGWHCPGADPDNN